MGAVDTPQPRAGKGKGKAFRRPKRRVGIRIDMTPMVDVAFLLLIFFMVTTVFRLPQAMELNLPPKDAEVDVAESSVLMLYVYEDGKNVFRDDKSDRFGMSKTALQLIAGIMQHAAAITAFANPLIRRRHHAFKLRIGHDSRRGVGPGSRDAGFHIEGSAGDGVARLSSMSR